VPPGAPSETCVTNNAIGATVFDLSTAPGYTNTVPIPSAEGVGGANIYVGYCGYCDATAVDDAYDVPVHRLMWSSATTAWG
jgi:hypothetical protein